MDNELKKSVLQSGTSLVGIVCKDGVVMAGDRRSTAGTIVMNKNKQKVVMINDYLVLSGTGVASDIEMLQKIVRAELRLKELKSKFRPSVKEAANLIATIAYRNIRQFSTIAFVAGTMVGGFNEDGSAELYTVEPAGSAVQVEDFDANFSSGMPYILGLLERQYKKDISVTDAIDLAVEALKASTQRDIASGNGFDVMTITSKGIKHVVEQIITPEYKNQK
ncbi:hypothetical protein GOV14_04585 [Candidatus Pacearchaeota archaeon]|nr:hypothetical protein [Candidatus Pacearchaeota archaeon]